jgi:hypothetical protein
VDQAVADLHDVDVSGDDTFILKREGNVEAYFVSEVRRRPRAYPGGCNG